MSSKLRKVLILTYYWPPASGPGVQRILKFSKFLREFNWEPIVLTVKEGSYPAVDDTLLKDIPDGIEVHKTKTMEPFLIYNWLKGKKGKSGSVGMIGMEKDRTLFKRMTFWIRSNFFIPDARVGWKRYAVAKASEIIRKGNIEAIITTGPPHSTHLSGLELKRKFGLPWIADFRDPWVNIYYNKLLPRSEKVINKDQAYEDSVLQEADEIITVSDGMVDEFKDRTKNITAIYNGFDLDDLKDVGSTERKTEKFRLSYIGNFKPNQNVETLWKSLGRITGGNEEFKKELEIVLVGNYDSSIVDSINQYGLKSNLKLKGFVSHHEATNIMGSINLLLFIVPQAEKNHYIITGKLFEYLASGSEMLSLGPVNGNAAKILENCGRNGMIEYGDAARMEEQILAAYQYWKSNIGESKRYDLTDEVLMYSRRGQTEQLASILNKLGKK